MKQHHAFALVFVLFAITAAQSIAQGPLEAPKAPEPSMKTLDQVEARTPVDSQNTPGDPISTFIISSPGSYYLTANVNATTTTGVRVQANGVTLDLNGFEIFGSGGGGSGIQVEATNCSIKNGAIRDVSRGIFGFFADRVRLENIRITGTITNAIELRDECVISDCRVEDSGGVGIKVAGISTIRDCVVHDTGSHGIQASVTCTIEDNLLNNIRGDGIWVNDQCVVRSNLIDFPTSGGAGIHVTGTLGLQDCRMEDNTVLRRSVGLQIDDGGNYVSGNIVKGNVVNYDLAPDNQLNLLISELPEQIDWPAYVTLAGTLTGISEMNGITVSANDVTIDLAGHSLVGVSGSLDGIHVLGSAQNVAIENGTIRDWDGDGINASTSTGCVFRTLRLLNNDIGLNAFSGSDIRECVATANQGVGFRIAGFAGLLIPSVLSACYANENGSHGFDVMRLATVRDCVASSNDGDGFRSEFELSIVDCSAVNNGGVGIRSVGDALIRGNFCVKNSSHEISTGGRSIVDGNQVLGRIHVYSTGSLITRNVSSTTTTNYIIAADNRYGPIVDVKATGTPAVNGPSAADTTTTTHPWANFSY